MTRLKKWAEDLNRFFFPPKKTKGGPQAHEKMLSSANHQRNTNQIHNEISPHTCQSGHHQKNHKNEMLARIW